MNDLPSINGPSIIPFPEVVAALLDEDNTLAARFLYRLSDLEPEQERKLALAWPKINVQRRQALMEDVDDLSVKDTLLDFTALGRLALQDSDAQVRMLAVRTLWEYEDKHLPAAFIKLVEHDSDLEVRAAAAGALGRYVYLGEIEELPEKIFRQVEDCLLQAAGGQQPVKVRQRALEALGFSSRPEVVELIQSAYHSQDKSWVASALLAMGRSSNKQWRPQVLEALESDLPLVCSEAVRAAGELEIKSARPVLLELLSDPDEAIRFASILALSQIGGEGVRDALEELYEETDDEEELGLLDEALENLEFNEGLALIPLLDISDPDEWAEDFDSNFEAFEDEYLDDSDEDDLA
jgi:HEAT repeat protein